MTGKFRAPAALTAPRMRLAPVGKPRELAIAGELATRPVAILGVAGLLVLSGMCGLIYQLAWFREFRLVFGASTAASSAVLAVFMGGLGIGNAVLGRRADLAKCPLLLYALLELSIAVTAALSPLFIAALHRLYISTGGQLTLGFTLATAVRLAISTLALGLPTFLMGGTLPAAVRAVTTVDDRQRRGAALLYGANTLGAVAGALTSTFFALELFGTRGTLWLACTVNVATGLLVLTLSRTAAAPAEPLLTRQQLRKSARTKVHAAHSISKDDSSILADAEIGTVRSLPLKVVYLVAGLTGFAFFLLELVWYRMLSPILGGTTFTFGLILAVALAGIGLGGAAYALLFRRRSVSLNSLALTCALEACCIAIPFALGDRVAVWAVMLRVVGATHFWIEAAGWALVVATVVLPAALVSGIQFPLLIGLLGQGDRDVGKQLGYACGWNTVGAIAGSLAGGFGLLPLLSAPGTWRAVAGLMTALSIALVAYARRETKARHWTIATAAGAGLAVCMIICPGPTAVWRHGAVGAGRIAETRTFADVNDVRDWENEVRRAVLWEADGVESSVAIVGADGLAFYVNGMCDGNAVEDVGTQVMFGLIGGALHPQPRTALVVGLGTGETAGWLADVSSVERVDVVELEPAVLEMARRCRAVNRDVLANSKVRMIFNDAREVLLTTKARYDLIVCEPSNPYRSGIANLFTQEFYRAGRERLNRDGRFVQWVQAYEIDRGTLRTVLATFQSIFPHVEVWQSKVGDLVLVGSATKPEYSESQLRRTVATQPFATALPSAWHTSDLEGLLSHYLGGDALVERFIGEEAAPINTDDRNAIEYGFARTLGCTDWNAPAALYRESVEIGDERPCVAGNVDWSAVARAHAWEVAVRGKKLSAEEREAIAKTCDAVLDRYVAKDARGMLAAWEAAPHSAPGLIELATIAHVYAEAGDSQAEPLIAKLASQLPAEAEALRGILAWRQGRLSESARRLESALVQLRSEPWMLEHIRLKAFDAAISVAKADPTQAATLLEAFAAPLAANYADERRRLTACVLAEGLGPATAARFVETFEPHIPWSEQFLSYRQRTYRETGHPLAARAERDVQEFLHR